ncbi:hypothetical protein AUP68_10838 [Ilyonectria robusta]
MQTDATFNTNCLHLPLSVIVGITNTGKTFPLAFAFITSESAEAFEFVNAQLAELVWYDCPPPQVVLGDQSKGLTAAMAVSQGRTDQGCQDGQILQLCEWHVAQNFKKRLLDSGNYTKERREELSWQLPLQTSCQKLAESLKKLTKKITGEEDRSRADVPRLLDRAAFQHLIGRVPHYVLSMVAPEWEAAKALRWRQNRELEKECEALSALNKPGCPFACELPLRYSLPCRHWLYEAVVRSWAIPLTLLHPRWLLDGPPVVRNWTMSYGEQTVPEDAENLGDRYQDGGRNMILQSALEVVRVQGSFTGQQAEEFSRLFRLQNDRLMAGFRKQEESRTLLPPRLPEASNRSSLKEFKSHGSTKRRSMTGCEVAEHAATRADRTELETKRTRKPSAKATEMAVTAAEQIRTAMESVQSDQS